jgi:hypothetical protein
MSVFRDCLDWWRKQIDWLDENGKPAKWITPEKFNLNLSDYPEVNLRPSKVS